MSTQNIFDIYLLKASGQNILFSFFPNRMYKCHITAGDTVLETELISNKIESISQGSSITWLLNSQDKFTPGGLVEVFARSYLTPHATLMTHVILCTALVRGHYDVSN